MSASLPSDNPGSQTHAGGHLSVKAILLVFAGLAVLTGATVALSYLGLPHTTGICLAALIAIAKCTLIGAFFMHLKWERWVIFAVFFTALALVGVLIGGIFPDVGIPQ
jgi:caa(3)-type oxidase subunit IV